MGTAISLELSNERIEVELRPSMTYTPPALCIRAGAQVIELYLSNEQLAEIEYPIREHLSAISYPETPDQQQILHAEAQQSMEEGTL
ncbi:hypothetical protein Q5741_18855 [Paenibacillus sp. JX-17]|uniref:Uncharacterized protein n=1 Tax=Paenibacillus lacisoli TaxID=3064525 RepID=A0ABT9CGQ1_9BACL|nr:hypothetical protein [Paenibacillus sp. JX-17]MDO7908464.1 hypothetical protein [Paenibacillus sp. JX-17]